MTSVLKRSFVGRPVPSDRTYSPWGMLAAIERSGRLSSYGDATPIYVRLAEAEVKLAQKKDG